MTVGSLRTPLALLVELLWCFAAVAIFVQVFGQDDGPAPSFALVALVVVGSFGLARLLQATEFDEDTIRTVGLGGVAVAFFLAVRIEYAPDEWPWDPGWLTGLLSDWRPVVEPNGNVIAAIIAITPLWVRGILRGQQSELEFDDVLPSVSLGLIVVLVAALSQPETREPSSWGAYAFAYCIVAIVTLAVFRAPEPGAPLTQFARRWAWGIAMLGGVAFGAALLAVAADPETFGFLSPVADPLRSVGDAIGRYVLAPIFWVISLPFQGIGALLGLLFGDPEPREPPPPTEPTEPDPADEGTPVWLRVLTGIGIAGGLLFVTALVGIVLWSAFKRFARRRAAARAVRYDSIEPSSSLREDLGALLGAFARRFQRDPRSASTIAVRRLYAEMLADAEARGLTRTPSMSPLAFAPALDQHYSSGVPGEISAAFTESRYGEREINDSRVAEMRSRWRTLKAEASPP